MTSLKIYLQQSHRFQDFSHNDIGAWKTSNARKCTKPLAQRYKTKQDLRQNSTKSIKLFDFLIFYVIFGFLTQETKRLIKQKKYSQEDKQTTNNKNSKHTKQTLSQGIGSINAWTCCNAYAWVPFFTHTSLAFGVISL